MFRQTISIIAKYTMEWLVWKYLPFLSKFVIRFKYEIEESSVKLAFTII